MTYSLMDRNLLLVAGYANMDLIAPVSGPTLPGPGERITVSEIAAVPGGMAANTACVAGKLGARVEFFGTVGDDDYGREILADFQRHQVGTSWIQVDSRRKTSRCLIFVFPSGERTLVSEELHFDYEPLIRFLNTEESHEAAVLHLDGYHFPLADSVIDLAHRNQIRVSADLDGIGDLDEKMWQSIQKLDVLFMNQSTMSRLFGETDPAQAFTPLFKNDSKTIIVTLGKNGACLVESYRTHQVPGIPTPVKDTVGAGDVLSGAYLAYYLRFRDPVNSVIFANAAASLSVTGSGARGFIPERRQVIQRLRW